VAQRRLDEAPTPTEDAFVDAWIGAAQAYLARRWGLEVWTRRPEPYGPVLLVACTAGFRHPADAFINAGEFLCYSGILGMADPSRSSVNIDTVISAFEVMGEYLRERELLGEIAIYGGTAILLQFDWRKTTEDVDAIIRTNEREGAVKDAIAYAALRLGLPDDWLNTFVGGFTPETEPDAFFSTYGTYPRGSAAGLRVFLARPEYLCAMKLKALHRDDVGDRDFEDAIRLGLEIGIGSANELARLFAAFFPEEALDPIASARLPKVAQAIQARRRG
jgi:hypothetical protein